MQIQISWLLQKPVGFFGSQLIWFYTVCKGSVSLDSAWHGLITKCLDTITPYYTCAKICWVRQRCHVSYITVSSNRDLHTVGQGLLSLQQVRVEGEIFISSVSSLSFIFFLLPYPRHSSPLLSLLSIFSLSLGDDTKWPTMVDMS